MDGSQCIGVTNENIHSIRVRRNSIGAQIDKYYAKNESEPNNDKGDEKREIIATITRVRIIRYTSPCGAYLRQIVIKIIYSAAEKSH